MATVGLIFFGDKRRRLNFLYGGRADERKSHKKVNEKRVKDFN